MSKQKKQNPSKNPLVEEKIKYLEKEARAKEKEIFQLKNLIDTIPGDVYWKDKNGIWSGLNKQCAISLCRMGFISKPDTTEVLGKTDHQLFDKKTADGYRKNDLEVMKNQVEISREENTRLASGEIITILSNKKPFLDDKGNVIGIIGNTIDITYQKKVEKALHKAKEFAEIANNAKSEFMTNMSHDLRTPLSGVVGMSELLKSEINEPGQKQYAEWIHDCSHQLLDLLNNILDMISLGNTQEDEVKLIPFDVRLCLEELAHLEMPTVKLKGLDLLINIDKKIPQLIITDRLKLHRILLNLLGNAIKFTQSGHVAIDAKLLKLDKQKALIYFAVSDTGIGIPKKHQDKVFNRFHKVNASHQGIYKGHGVGLHIAQTYTALLGGELQLNSEVGVGSTFYFELPVKVGKPDDTVCDKARNKPAKIHSEKETVNNEKIKNEAKKPTESSKYVASVLIVEDNVIARRLLEHFIEKENLSYQSAECSKDALHLFKNNSFDLVITDIGLPDASGFELTSAIRAWEIENHKQSIPIIGLSAHTEESEASDEAQEAGMTHLFQKPAGGKKIKAILSYLNNDSSESTYSLKVSEKKPNNLNNSSKTTGLGLDLPEKEEDLYRLDEFPILSEQDALEHINDMPLLIESIKTLAVTQIPETCHELKEAYAQNDWKQIEHLAHKLKGGILYTGTIRLQLASQFVERGYKADLRDHLEPLYTQLLHVLDETQQTLLEWLRRYNF